MRCSNWYTICNKPCNVIRGCITAVYQYFKTQKFKLICLLVVPSSLIKTLIIVLIISKIPLSHHSRSFLCKFVVFKSFSLQETWLITQEYKVTASHIIGVHHIITTCVHKCHLTRSTTDNLVRSSKVVYFTLPK